MSAKRKPDERGKDILYVHDTLELFARSLSELNEVWSRSVRPQLGPRAEVKLLRARNALFGSVTDTIREAALMATGRQLTPESLRELCDVGLGQLMDEARNR